MKLEKNNSKAKTLYSNYITLKR